MNKNKTKATAKPAVKKPVRTGGGLSESAKNKIIILSLVGALLLGCIVIAIFAIIDYVKRDPNFDYLTSNLDRYVYLSEDDYKDFEMKLDIAKPRDIDVDVVMLNLLASNAKLPAGSEVYSFSLANTSAKSPVTYGQIPVFSTITTFSG